MNSLNPLQRLHPLGQSFWWDTLSRRQLEDGTVAAMRDENGMRGITSNPSIFQKAIAGSDDYDGAIVELARQGVQGEDVFWRLAVEDIQMACSILRPVFDESKGEDGYVSLEVDPRLAFETEKTLSEARRLWIAVDRPNLMIKIPGTPEGVPAVRQALIEGINVNVTLLFAQEAHVQVMEAYLEALEARLDRGERVDDMASVASFFVSRVDSMIDDRLDAEGSERAKELRGRAGVANAKLAYDNYLGLFSGPRWEKLAAAGARVQRPLWASTSVKDPAYPDVMYVEELIGRDTVNTMPTNTVEAMLDHGDPQAETVRRDVDRAREDLAGLAEVGVDIEEITTKLLEEGVDKFEVSFQELLESVKEKARQLSS